MVKRLGAVAAVLAAGVGSFNVWTSSAETGPALIRISGTQKHYFRVDTGAKGRSPGDTEIIWQQLFNRRITPKAIGHAEFVCRFTVDTSRLCEGTFFLPKGRLMVSGAMRFRQIYELAIVGGTGLYNNARGTLTATRTHRSPRREFLIFRLAG